MNSEKKSQVDAIKRIVAHCEMFERILKAFWIVLAVLAVLLLIGCTSTVRLHSAVASVASFDGDVQNSGLIGFTAEGDGILTRHAVDRYNGLCVVYGNDFNPAVNPGDGVKPKGDNAFTIDRQHLVYFATMNRWFKSGKIPSR